jgi:hypothetical protein
MALLNWPLVKNVKRAHRKDTEYPHVPLDTNHLEREIRAIAVCRRNRLF